MLSSADFIRQSIDIHLFLCRIMKEHSFFLEAAFTQKDSNYIRQADSFRNEFDRLLADVVSISNGAASPGVLQSGEVITPYTLEAENATAYFTGVRIPTAITQSEAGLMSGNMPGVSPAMERRVADINQRAISLVTALIQFKENILNNVLSCKMFTVNYPLLIVHIIREARLYLLTLQRLQNREEINIEKEAYEQEFFWNRQMAEHAKFIRGLLDPTENDLFNIANDFGNEFDKLTAEAKASIDKTVSLVKVTNDSMMATRELCNFKEQGTQGILECKVKSIIIPLLGDHVLREANHYLRLLKRYEKITR